MKRALLLTSLGVIFCVAFSRAQNVFNPSDPIIRYVATDGLGASTHPDPTISGLQKWVSTPTNGVSTGSGAYDVSSYKAYFINIGGAQMCFRLKFPKSYTNPDSAGKKYPIMLFFHGAGEPGCPSNNGIYNNEKQLVHGGQSFRDKVDQGMFDGFLFYPQAQTGSGCWGSWGIPHYSAYYDLMLSVIDSLVKYARVNNDRVLVTGLSDGGKADWYSVGAYPQRIAKAAIASAAIPTDVTNLADFVHIPIWFATGGKDTNPNPAYAQGSYNSMATLGADIKWTLYPDLGHGVWNTYWAEPDFPAYMNDMHKANPLIFFQKNQVCPDSVLDVKIGITAGFYAYEWQKDGVTIATSTNGANTIIDGSSLISFTGNEMRVKSFGTYRVRFKRSASGDWSEFSPKPAVISPKPVTQTPPITVAGIKSVVLPAVDQSTSVTLQLPSGYTGYRWYNAVDSNTVIATTPTYTAAIGQYYARVGEQNGCGTRLSPIFTVVNAAGTPKPEPAKNLRATTASLTSIQLDWSTNPNAGERETGYEIYRADSSGGPYKLLTVAPQGSVGYLDQALPSNKKYYYVVRAVGKFGAAANSNEASAQTAIDNIPPTAPSNVKILASGGSYAFIQWTASTDNVGVFRYDIYLNGSKTFSTTQTSFTLAGLDSNTIYSLTIKARDAAGNVSAPSSQLTFSTIFNTKQGINYKYYLGSWSALPDFNSLTPQPQQPPINNVILKGAQANYYGFLWYGYIKVPTSANYTFEVCSDDGSAVYVGQPYIFSNTPTVNNDGLHGAICKSGSIYLTAGVHPIEVVFFQATGAASIALNWQNDAGLSKQAVPDNVLFYSYDGTGTGPAAPGNLAAAATSATKINLTWTNNGGTPTGFEVARSTSSSGTFLPVATVTGTAFTDTALTASTAYYYKVRAIGATGESVYTSTVTATTQVMPPAPNAPTNLAVSLSSGNNAALGWTINSTNETGFEVWRSVGNNTTYRLLTTVASAKNSYTDSALFANVTYYYKVRAIGAGLPSAYTNEVSIGTLNTAPKMDNVLDFTVHYDSTYVLPIRATDADGDPLTFTAIHLPSFATIQNVSNGNANIIFKPGVYDLSGYTITVKVSDGHNGYDSVLFGMMVNDNGVPVMNAIPNVTMNEGEVSTLDVTANDPEGNQYMQWSFKNKPSFVTFTNNGNGRGTLQFKPGYTAAGFYIITVIADDGFGAWTSRNFNLTVNHKNPNLSIQSKITFYTPAPALWNDITVQNSSTATPSSFNVPNLKSTRNEVTTVGVNSLTTNFISGNNGAINANNPAISPTAPSVFPESIIANGIQWGFDASSNSNDTVKLRVYGLDPKLRYNFVFFGSNGCPWCQLTSSLITTYIIGNQKVTGHYYLNRTETDTIYQVAPNSTGEVFITMAGDPDVTKGGMLNALVINAQFDDGTVPVKPGKLTVKGVTGGGTQLNWIDNSITEYGYRVYRSNSASGPYTLLSPVVAIDSTSFRDQGTVPFTKYYYYVAGFNRWGEGAHSDTVNITTSNNAPVVSPLNNMYIKSDATAQQDFTASDDPGDVVTVSVLNKPSFITLTSLGGINYRLTASPTVDNIGSGTITISVSDDKGAVVNRTITISVADKYTRSVFLNLGAWPDVASTPWNNLPGYIATGTTKSNLNDENGTSTLISVKFLDNWTDVTHLGFGTRTAMGFITGNNSGIYPDTVLLSGVMDNALVQHQITISGLDDTKRYNVIFMGSQNDGRSAVSIYSIGTQKDTLDARYNAHQTANMNGLTSSGGALTFTITKLKSTDTIYLNAIVIEEYVPTLAKPLNPLYLYAEPKDRNNMWLYWTDRTNNETGFELQRATDSLFTTNLVTISLPANTTAYTNTGLSPDTKYWYRVRAIAGSASDWSNRTKAITPRSIVYLNFNYSVASAPAPWNNTYSLPNTGFSFPNLVDQSNSPSGVTVTIEQPFNGENLAGVNTGNNSGIVPDVVLQDNYWIDNTQLATMRVSGLNQSKRYRFGFIGSMSTPGWFLGDYTATYTINGRTVYLNSWMNSSKIVYIGDVVPDTNGEVLLNFSTTPDASWNFSGGVIIEAYNDVYGGGQLNRAIQTNNERPVVQEADQARMKTGPDKVYPNPFFDVINLDFNNSAANNYVSADVYDLGGRLIMRRNFGRLSPGFNTLKLNTAEVNLVAGIYMITINVNGKPVHATKMVKVRN